MVRNFRQITTNTGFTLVELIVVIAVIVILASITLASYVGVQNQAKAEKTKTNAGTVAKVVETYYNINNVYPTQVSHFRSTYATMSLDVALSVTEYPPNPPLNALNAENAILYRYVGGGAGACVMRWDYFPASGPAGIVTTNYFGTATSANCNSTTGSLPGNS